MLRFVLRATEALECSSREAMWPSAPTVPGSMTWAGLQGLRPPVARPRPWPAHPESRRPLVV